jgi:hypothetical protein
MKSTHEGLLNSLMRSKSIEAAFVEMEKAEKLRDLPFNYRNSLEWLALKSQTWRTA